MLVLAANQRDPTGLGPAGVVILSVLYAIAVVTIGHWMTNRILPLIQAKFSWPGGTLGFVVSFTLGSATFSLWIGLHNTLGA